MILGAVLMLCMSSCSKNNGDIGYWFGMWHLDSIEIDGEPDDGYDGNFYFMFQGKVFCVRWLNEAYHEYVESYARWEENTEAKTVTINFADSRFPSQIVDYAPSIYLNTVTTMTVEMINSTTMVLNYTSNDTGVTYTYRLTHWE